MPNVDKCSNLLPVWWNMVKHCSTHQNPTVCPPGSSDKVWGTVLERDEAAGELWSITRYHQAFVSGPTTLFMFKGINSRTLTIFDPSKIGFPYTWETPDDPIQWYSFDQFGANTDLNYLDIWAQSSREHERRLRRTPPGKGSSDIFSLGTSPPVFTRSMSREVDCALGHWSSAIAVGAHWLLRVAGYPLTFHDWPSHMCCP